jgi:hypothetical protein
MNNKNTHNQKLSEKELDSLAETFVSKLGQLRLSKTEAHEMRERLLSYTNLHTVSSSSAHTAKAVRSPFLSYFSSYSRVLVAGTLVVLILISTTGVSYAAENTLPGQALYGVKIAIVEPIQGAFITSTSGKANWQATLAERRLIEASTLAAENKLSTSTQQYLAQAVSTHIALAQEDANNLSATGDATDALAVRSDLDASLSANATVFADVAPRLAANGDSTTSTAVVALLNSIETDRTQVDISRVDTQVALGDSATPSAVVPATPKQKKILAYVNEENSHRSSEEMAIIKQNTALFRLLPNASSSASTTASSTVASTTSVSASSTLGHFPFYRLHVGGTTSTAVSATGK